MNASPIVREGQGTFQEQKPHHVFRYGNIQDASECIALSVVTAMA